jgi:hypothetical protein
MAYNNIASGGALIFAQLIKVKPGRNCDVISTAAGERLLAPKSSGLAAGDWAALHICKPYSVQWFTVLNNHQVDHLADVMLRLYHGTEHLAEWRQGLADAEHQALISGTFATLSGISTVAGGIAMIGDLLSGGIPLMSGLWTAGSGMAFGCNLGQLEAAAKRGDLCVQQINRISMELIQLGRQIDLPFCTPHHTPVIQSACTGLAQAFGWSRGQIDATQAGILSWIEVNPRFASA